MSNGNEENYENNARRLWDLPDFTEAPESRETPKGDQTQAIPADGGPRRSTSQPRQARNSQTGQNAEGRSRQARERQYRQPQVDQTRQMAVRPMSEQEVASGFVPATDLPSSRKVGKNGKSPYSQYSRGAVNYSTKVNKGMSTGKKVVIAIVIIALLGLIAAGGFYIYKEMRKTEINNDLHNMEKEELEAIDAQLTGHTSFDEPFTMLLLGSDERFEEDTDVEGARTDTIILVRVDAPNKSVSMISIPRDTMIELPGVGTTKITSAYDYGGAASTIAAVKDLTGVDIDHYALVNFDGLIGLVDAIGGIDVYVDERIDNPKAGPEIVEAGEQHLNGAQALVLARDRDYYDGDYTRQVNQRKVIMGIIERLMNTPASELAGIIQASTSFIQTDSGIDFDWLFSLADQIRHTDTEHPLEVKATTLPSAPAYVGEISYVIADRAGMAELMEIFMSGGDVSQPLTQSSISTDVANAGGSYGASSSGYEEEYYYYEEEYYDDSGYDDSGYVEEAPIDEGGGEIVEEGGE